MNHVFMVKLSRAAGFDLSFEVVAPNASKAIIKAKAQARRESTWRGSWMVSELLHRGAAV